MSICHFQCQSINHQPIHQSTTNIIPIPVNTSGKCVNIQGTRTLLWPTIGLVNRMPIPVTILQAVRFHRLIAKQYTSFRHIFDKKLTQTRPMFICVDFLLDHFPCLVSILGHSEPLSAIAHLGPLLRFIFSILCTNLEALLPPTHPQIF